MFWKGLSNNTGNDDTREGLEVKPKWCFSFPQTAFSNAYERNKTCVLVQMLRSKNKKHIFGNVP